MNIEPELLQKIKNACALAMLANTRVTLTYDECGALLEAADLYESSQSHVAELLADNASLRAQIVALTNSAERNAATAQEAIEEAENLRADLKTARDALVIGGQKRAKLEQEYQLLIEHHKVHHQESGGYSEGDA